MPDRSTGFGTRTPAVGSRGGRYGLLLGLLGLVFASTLVAGFLAPADPAEQNRDFSFAPPTRLHFVDPKGGLHLRPFVYAIAQTPGSFGDYAEDRSRIYP